MAAQTHTTPAPGSFKAAFCECFGCAVEAFQETLFWKCVRPALRPVASLVRLLSPRFFRPDLEYLGQVGETTTWEGFWTLATRIHEDLALNHGLLRKGLHLRISGSRLIELYREITRHRRESFL